MKKLIHFLTCVFVALAALSLSGCTGANSTNSASQPALKAEDELFVKSTWMQQDFVQKLKDRKFDSAWISTGNRTGFSTFLNEVGKPYWIATIPDQGGELNYRAGKWCLGENPIVEFFVEGKDTLARYFVTAAEFNGKGGEDHPQIYQRVPCVENPNSRVVDDWYISDECAYFIYFFAGRYEVVDAYDTHSTVELFQDGTAGGNALWDKYGINTVNSLPVFYLGRDDSYNGFVINGNDSGFSLSAMLNAETLEGDGNEILQGQQVYEFVRR